MENSLQAVSLLLASFASVEGTGEGRGVGRRGWLRKWTDSPSASLPFTPGADGMGCR